jgi:hypothetical protein
LGGFIVLYRDAFAVIAGVWLSLAMLRRTRSMDQHHDRSIPVRSGSKEFFKDHPSSNLYNGVTCILFVWVHYDKG